MCVGEEVTYNNTPEKSEDNFWCPSMLSTLFVTMPAHKRKTRVKDMFYHTWLHVGLGNSNSTPYVCAVSTLSAEPHPQPREEYFV